MLYLNKLCRKPITTANYDAVYLKQLRKYFAKRCCFFPRVGRPPTISASTPFFQKAKNKIVFTPRIAAWATNGKCCFYTKALGKENKWKTSGGGRRMKWTEMEYKSAIYFNCHYFWKTYTSSSIQRGKKNKQFKTMWLSTEPSRQHQPSDRCQSWWIHQPFKKWDFTYEEEQYTI